MARRFCNRVFPTFFACVAFTVPAFAQVGGIYIDAKGMLKHTSSLSQDQRLAMLRLQAVGQPGSKQLAAQSGLRVLSLRRLESTVAAAQKAGKDLPADVRFLAGLTRVQYIFFDPANADVLIAGPAEGWKQLPTGEVVGEHSGRPVLHLDDLIAALRYSFATKVRAEFIGCSIDPTPEGVKRYAAYLRKIGRIDRSRVAQIFAGMEQAMGPQDVRLFGVDPSSRFALTLVAADYRLKRIGMAHDPSPVKQVVNYLDLAARRPLATRQPQHRWWFLAEYDAINHSADKLAYELVGQGVKVATARTETGKNGRKRKAAPAARQFCEAFTTHFPQMAKSIPVFAELQNLIGLAVAAELIAQRSTGRSVKTWMPTHFLDEKACPLTKYPVPKTVPSLASYRLVRGRQWLISVSGGVELNPAMILKDSLKGAPSGSDPAEVLTGHKAPKDQTRWWWD